MKGPARMGHVLVVGASDLNDLPYRTTRDHVHHHLLRHGGAAEEGDRFLVHTYG